MFLWTISFQHKRIKERYSQEPAYKKLLDNGYQLLTLFIKERSSELRAKISQSQFKNLKYPDEDSANNGDTVVPSGAMFEFDYSNVTRIPDDMLEKMNLALENAAASGPSGCTVEDENIKILKKK